VKTADVKRPKRRDPVAAREVVVLKIGGAVAAEADAAIAATASLHDAGRPVVVVHGGGPLIGEWSERFGLPTRFVRGLRVTDEPTRDVAIAVLGGLANKTLVAALLGRGVPAVGLSGIDGGMLRAEREDAELGLVGRVTLVDSSLLEDLVEHGRVPVVAPAAIGPAGEILNVNGDAAAGAVAASLGARLLAFVTDVPGVRAKDGRIVPRLDRARSMALVEDGTIEGGMLPKVEACLLAAASGCEAAILPADRADAVERVLAGERVGTVFPAEVPA
jgi:acetylglutamate kinase